MINFPSKVAFVIVQKYSKAIMIRFEIEITILSLKNIYFVSKNMTFSFGNDEYNEIYLKQLYKGIIIIKKYTNNYNIK